MFILSLEERVYGTLIVSQVNFIIQVVTHNARSPVFQVLHGDNGTVGSTIRDLLYILV